MFHHISLPVENPQKTGEILATIIKGKLLPSIHPGCYMLLGDDGCGTMIEFIPKMVQFSPIPNEEGHPVRFQEQPDLLTGWHAALSVERSKEEIEKLANEAGWPCRWVNQGPYFVLAVWVEGELLLEFIPPEAKAQYLEMSTSRSWESYLQQHGFLSAPLAKN